MSGKKFFEKTTADFKSVVISIQAIKLNINNKFIVNRAAVKI